MIGGLFAGELTDGEAALRVYLAAGGLLVLGVLLLMLTVRWWRATRPEPPSLAPLEVMGERRWAKAPDPDRQRLLEQHRPASADGTTPILQPAPVDLAALARVPPRDFGDLADDGARLGDDVRVVGPMAGVAASITGASVDGHVDSSIPDVPDVADSSVDGSADSSVDQPDEIGIDETIALESDDDVEPVSSLDSTMALIAPDADALARIDDDVDVADVADDADDAADLDDVDDVHLTVIDTGETSAVAGAAHHEAGDAGASRMPGPTGGEDDGDDRDDVVSDDTGDVVQQALELDDELVDQSSGD